MRKIKNLFILPSFQLKLLIGCTLPVLISFSLLLLKLRLSFDTLEEQMMLTGFHRNPQVLNAIQSQEIILTRFMYLGVGLGILFTVITILFISHKLAGPIYRLKKELKERKLEHSSNDLKFREGDYLKDMEDDLNYFLNPKDEVKKAS